MLPAIRVDPRVENYILDLVRATRNPSEYDEELKEWIEIGASPRATIFLTRAARAQAFLDGRPFVLPEDVHALALDVLRHRVLMTFEAEAEEVTPDQAVRRLLEVVPVP
jgi:MoxR-like ATPase